MKNRQWSCQSINMRALNTQHRQIGERKSCSREVEQKQGQLHICCKLSGIGIRHPADIHLMFAFLSHQTVWNGRNKTTSNNYDWSFSITVYTVAIYLDNGKFFFAIKLDWCWWIEQLTKKETINEIITIKRSLAWPFRLAKSCIISLAVISNAKKLIVNLFRFFWEISRFEHGAMK